MVFLYIVLSSLAVFAGGIILFIGNWKEKQLVYLKFISATLILFLLVVEIIPESISENEVNVFYIILGFLLMHLSSFIFKNIHHCCDRNEDFLLKNSIFGLFAHSLLDGALIITGLIVNNELGVVLIVGLLFHKFQDGLLLSAVSLSISKNKKITVKNLTNLCFLTALGYIFFYVLASQNIMSENVLSLIYNLSVGLLLYISLEILYSFKNKG